eukprot:ANDGO_02015.mRNA.1 hypothetical protein
MWRSDPVELVERIRASGACYDYPESQSLISYFAVVGPFDHVVHPNSKKWKRILLEKCCFHKMCILDVSRSNELFQQLGVACPVHAELVDWMFFSGSFADVSQFATLDKPSSYSLSNIALGIPTAVYSSAKSIASSVWKFSTARLQDTSSSRPSLDLQDFTKSPVAGARNGRSRALFIEAAEMIGQNVLSWIQTEYPLRRSFAFASFSEILDFASSPEDAIAVIRMLVDKKKAVVVQYPDAENSESGVVKFIVSNDGSKKSPPDRHDPATIETELEIFRLERIAKKMVTILEGHEAALARYRQEFEGCKQCERPHERAKAKMVLHRIRQEEAAIDQLQSRILRVEEITLKTHQALTDAQTFHASIAAGGEIKRLLADVDVEQLQEDTANAEVLLDSVQAAMDRLDFGLDGDDDASLAAELGKLETEMGSRDDLRSSALDKMTPDDQYAVLEELGDQVQKLVLNDRPSLRREDISEDDTVRSEDRDQVQRSPKRQREKHPQLA